MSGDAEYGELLQDAANSHTTGQLDLAANKYRHILARWPKDFDATHLLGVVALQQGKLEEAQSLISSALEVRPNDAAALNNLATTLLERRDKEKALVAAQRALELAPDSVEFMVTYGTVLYSMDRVRDAIEPLSRAHNLQPRSSHIAGLLGACYLKTEEPRPAAAVFEAALEGNDQDPELWANLSVATNALGQHETALGHAERALSLKPTSTVALGAKASAHFEMGQLEDAISAYERAVAASPTASMLCAFANALFTSGLHADALKRLRHALELEPDNRVARWLWAVGQVMPMLESKQEIEQSRQSFVVNLDELQRWYESVRPAEAFRAVGSTQPFYLAYQPFNNRELMRKYGEVCVRWMRTLDDEYKMPKRPSAKNRKLQIGIASTHMRNHSVWVAVAKGWVEHLDKRRFDVQLFHLGLQSDTETLNARKHASQFHDQATDVVGWVDAIRNANLDALIYPAIGMDPISSQLAAIRLAPLQATTWGHPETSGLPTVDYYLSGELLEPPNAQDNYTEKLITLPNLSVLMEPLKPKMVDPRLDSLGLSSSEPLLLCPGSPFKYSPMHDWIWIQIAKGLAGRPGKLVFFAGSRGAMYGVLQTRLRKAFADAGVSFDDHVRFIAHLDRPRFFGLMRRSALMLDTIGFSGFNTAIQSVEAGLPILTFEGDFMRGRLASCLMRRMDIPDLIAQSPEEFIQKALKLAQDAGERKRLAKLTAKRSGMLFSDKAPVRAIENFLAETVERA